MGTKIKVLLVIMSLSLTLCFMSNTYSRYVADTTGNLEVLFAKWQILVNETDITDKTTSSITLIPVIDANDYVAPNKIAPSSKGHFDIDIDPTNVGVAFDYNITLETLNSNIPDLLVTKYSILDENYKVGDELKTTVLNSNTINGTGSNKPFTVRIYFEWREGNGEIMNNERDTELGYNAAVATSDSETFRVNANINFVQKIVVPREQEV